MKAFLHYLKRRAWIISMPLLLMTVFGNTAFASMEPSFSATAGGPTNNLTLTASLNVSDADTGKNGNMYLAFNFQHKWYLNDGTRWVPLNDGALPVYIAAPLANRVIEVLRDVNVSGLVGGQLYIGYGLNKNDMLANGKYGMVYTIMADATTSPAPRFSAIAGGYLDNLTLSARFGIADVDVGKTGHLYLAFYFNQTSYFHNGSDWVAFDGGGLPVYNTAPLANQVIDVVRNADMSRFVGGQLYIG